MKATGAVVKVEASGMARAWPMIPPLSGRVSGASGKTSFANQLRLDTVGFVWSHYCRVAVARR